MGLFYSDGTRVNPLKKKDEGGSRREREQPTTVPPIPRMFSPFFAPQPPFAPPHPMYPMFPSGMPMHHAFATPHLPAESFDSFLRNRLQEKHGIHSQQRRKRALSTESSSSDSSSGNEEAKRPRRQLQPSKTGRRESRSKERVKSGVVAASSSSSSSSSSPILPPQNQSSSSSPILPPKKQMAPEVHEDENTEDEQQDGLRERSRPSVASSASDSSPPETRKKFPSTNDSVRIENAQSVVPTTSAAAFSSPDGVPDSSISENSGTGRATQGPIRGIIVIDGARYSTITQDGRARTKMVRLCCFGGNCLKTARGGLNLCISHGGGRRCLHPGCTNGAEGGGVPNRCKKHGGGKRCKISGCKRAGRGPSDLCINHGGGHRCQVDGCTRASVGAQKFCVRHGGGRRCTYDGCTKAAQGKFMLCKNHGGGKCCNVVGCKVAVRNFYRCCNNHLQFCIFPGCITEVSERSDQVCAAHEESEYYFCEAPMCFNPVNSQEGQTRCSDHITNGVCVYDSCGTVVLPGDEYCSEHSTKSNCCVEACKEPMRTQSGLCLYHGSAELGQIPLLYSFISEDVPYLVTGGVLESKFNALSPMMVRFTDRIESTKVLQNCFEECEFSEQPDKKCDHLDLDLDDTDISLSVPNGSELNLFSKNPNMKPHSSAYEFGPISFSKLHKEFRKFGILRDSMTRILPSIPDHSWLQLRDDFYHSTGEVPESQP